MCVTGKFSLALVGLVSLVLQCGTTSYFGANYHTNDGYRQEVIHGSGGVTGSYSNVFPSGQQIVVKYNAGPAGVLAPVQQTHSGILGNQNAWAAPSQFGASHELGYFGSASGFVPSNSFGGSHRFENLNSFGPSNAFRFGSPHGFSATNGFGASNNFAVSNGFGATTGFGIPSAPIPTAPASTEYLAPAANPGFASNIAFAANTGFSNPSSNPVQYYTPTVSTSDVATRNGFVDGIFQNANANLNEIPTAEKLFTPATEAEKYPAETSKQIEAFNQALREEAEEAAKALTSIETSSNSNSYVNFKLGDSQEYNYQI